MGDPRLRRMAQVLLHYSLEVKQGERLGVRAEPVTLPLLQEIADEAIRIGAFPEIFIEVPGVKEMLLKHGSDTQVAYIPDSFRLIAEEYETAIDILSRTNTSDMNNVDPARLALLSQSQKDTFQTLRARCEDGSLRRSITLYPTNAYAQDAGMSQREFEDFVYHACFLDDEDPIARWQELSRQQDQLVAWMQGKRNVHIQGPDTDLTFSIAGRIFLNDDGRYNFPGGEFFTAPVEDSVNGYIHYNIPTSYGGRSVEDVRLRFEHGTVVEAQAKQGQAYLEKMLSADAGANRLGEFAFGNNPHINRSINNPLFDEKMSGTIHFALGASFPLTGGVNRSVIHWDMVYDLRVGAEVRIDGELVCKDGQIIVF
ncbi:aminopeptidase [Dictyobacter aurantiacus]|uniref:Aminopeptidase n=1 Tax=Dictyobacter aurantiacus TaxID=1936993 RepID=A0A401ZLI6_9CHLR|nr:aminopeptidase [Dictyobacter aurantiacus]GCE07688.1 aminopeptidase [Dictyobacter aurantiacus]